MFPGQCGNTAFFFKSQPDQFHFEFRGIVFPGKSFFSAHEVSTCKISGCLSYRILDSGPDGTQTTLTAILISEQTKLWDAKSSTGFTQGTLQQDAMNICENVVRTINARMVDVLESSKLLKTVELPVLTGSLTAKADAIMDALYENTESSFGSEVSDYGIIAHESQLKALSRLAAKQGFSGEDAIVDMLGTDIAYYNGEDKGVFMLAKRFTALSFGCFRHDGENITVVLSRDGDSQSHDLEILGKVFVVAEAATTIKMGTGSATAVLPVVKRLKFTKTEA